MSAPADTVALKLRFHFSDLFSATERTSYAYYGNYEYQVTDRLYDAMEEEASSRAVSVDDVFCELQNELALMAWTPGPAAQKLGFVPADLVVQSHYIIRTSPSGVGYKISDRLYAAIYTEAKSSGRSFVSVFAELQEELVSC